MKKRTREKKEKSKNTQNRLARVEPEIFQQTLRRENRKALRIISLLALAGAGYADVLIMRSSVFRTVFLFSAVLTGIFALICIYAWFFPGNSIVTDGAVFLLEASLYMWAVMAELILGEGQGISGFLLMLTGAAMLFVSPPFVTALIQLLAAGLYCFAEYTYVRAGRFYLIFSAAAGLLSCFLTWFLVRRRRIALRGEADAAYRAVYDPLTGFRNEQQYQESLNAFSGDSESLAIVLIDAVRYNEINETQGFEEGRRMLCFVAAGIQKLFGEDHTFRIGEESFAAILHNPGIDEVRESIRELKSVCGKRSYPVCAGWAFEAYSGSGPDRKADVSRIAKAARRELSLDRADYFRKSGDIIESTEAGASLTQAKTEPQPDAERDRLTGLYTQEAFCFHSQRLLLRNTDRTYHLSAMEIEGLPAINEEHGKDYGDELLKTIGRILLSKRVSCETAGRYGNTRFVVLFEEKDSSAKDGYEEQLMNVLGDQLKNSRFRNVVIKFGFYRNVDNEEQVEILCERAIAALQKIRFGDRKKYAYFDDSLLSSMEQARKIEGEMENELSIDQFRVFYQPLHETGTGKVSGAEALLRWFHPEHGYIPPGSFIPVFEKKGFVTSADLYVWEKICRNQILWKRAGLSVVPISVNVSGRELSSEHYWDNVRKLIRKYELGPDDFMLEIKGDLMSRAPDQYIPLLQRLHADGFQIILDGFGAGAVSMDALTELPLSMVKMDIRFMRQFEDERKRAVLSSCISMTHGLKLRAAAEGVETEEQKIQLLSMGCDYVQGYYYEKPLPDEEFKAYLEVQGE